MLYTCENAILLQTREINKNLLVYKGSGSENKFRPAICIKIKNSLLSTAAFCAKLSFIVHHQINQQPIIQAHGALKNGGNMAVLRTILTVILILVSIAFTIVVLMQEGKSAGLGAISGAAETYWGKNKGRSMEGALVRITTVLGVVFMILAVVLNINF